MKKILRFAAAASRRRHPPGRRAFPTKPVTLVVPFTAGGPTDLVARGIAQGMTKPLGQSVVVENTAGAGGTIAATRVKNATPDGHTAAAYITSAWRPRPPCTASWRTTRSTDFEMVAMVVDTPMTLIARSDFPAKDVNEFVEYVKANKTKLNLAHAGVGSASHLCGLLFQSTIQTEVTTIPFKGTADALNALLGKTGRLPVRPVDQHDPAHQRRHA